MRFRIRYSTDWSEVSPVNPAEVSVLSSTVFCFVMNSKIPFTWSTSDFTLPAIFGTSSLMVIV